MSQSQTKYSSSDFAAGRNEKTTDRQTISVDYLQLDTENYRAVVLKLGSYDPQGSEGVEKVQHQQLMK